MYFCGLPEAVWFGVIRYLNQFRHYVEMKAKGNIDYTGVKRDHFYHKGKLYLGERYHTGVHQSFCEEEYGINSETSFHVLGIMRKTRMRSISSRRVKKSGF